MTELVTYASSRTHFLFLILTAYLIYRHAGFDILTIRQRLGASVAFYALLSLAPLPVILVALLAAIFGKRAAEGQLASEVEHFIGSDGAKSLQSMPATAIA